LKKSAIILAGGSSSRLGQDKCLLTLAGKPLIQHILATVRNITEESLLIFSSNAQAQQYKEFANEKTRLFVETTDTHTPLAGAARGFEKAHGEYSILLPCDTPLVSRDILLLLFELCENRNAAIPRWPDGRAEPLQAVYRSKPALEASKGALSAGELNVQAMLDRLQNVRFVSTLLLAQLDPELKTFFNINTPIDLNKAESLLKSI
jgi:molybdopterin-guanine dinucleotide biosynthesis protein A